MNSSKLALTITAVVLVHLVAGTVILLQPGCKSDGQKATTPPPAEAANATVATTTPELAEPTRPAPITPSTPVAEGSLASSEPLTSTTDINGTGPTAMTAGPTSTYVVKSRDTLSKIAHEEKVSLKDLMAANSLTSTSKLRVGQTLTIPASAGGATSAPTPSANTSTATPAEAAATGNTHAYTVKSGDSLSKIAHKNGTTVAAIKAANHMTSDSITVGKVLTLPGEGTASAGASTDSLSAPTASATALSAPTAPVTTDPSGVYVVKSGDSLDTIAKKHGVKVSELMTLNNITNPKSLQIGQKLKLSSGSAAAGTSTAAASATASSTTPPAATPLSSVNAVAPVPANSTTPPTGSPADNVPVTPVTN